MTLSPLAELKTNIKVTLLNAENLFLIFDSIPKKDPGSMNELEWQQLSNSVYEIKSLKKTLDLAKAIKHMSPDLILLVEVGGQESLHNFNKYFLNEEYSTCLIEGNSNRNIDVGFMIRKSSPFYFDLASNKNRSINYLYPHERQSQQTGYPVPSHPSHKFSRDVAELRLFKNDREKPFMMLLLTHLKSRLDPDHVDPNGFERRQAELKSLVEIYNELSAQFPKVPFLVAGDFNGYAGILNPDEEFKDIYEKTKLKDVLEIKSLPVEERCTYYNVRPGGRTEGKQIDYIFISEDLVPKVKDAYVYRYKDEFGSPYNIPNNLEAKGRLPSDHYPIFLELKDIDL